MPYNEINGPGVYSSQSVTTSAAELKVGASPLGERKVVSIQPIDGEVYYGFDGSVTSSNGTKIFKGEKFFLECGSKLPIYLVAASGTVDTRIAEYA